MNLENPILVELKTMAPSLVVISRVTPYALQDGYFDDLSTNILKKIKFDAQIIDPFLVSDGLVKTPFDVPKKYFDDFANTVLTKINLEKIQPSTYSIPIFSTTPYLVPSDYFTLLPDLILSKIKILHEEVSVVEDSFNKITPYEIPIGYFENVASEILDTIYNMETNEIYNMPKKRNTYTIPLGYFNNLSVQILDRINNLDIEQVSRNFVTANPYHVPVDYFEGLADNLLVKVNSTVDQEIPAGYFAELPGIILQKVRAFEVKNELEEFAPLLNTVNKSPINHVPAGYFKGLQPVLPKAAPAKVLAIKKTSGWLKNAVAACLIGTLGFTAYQIMDASTKRTTSIQSISQEVVPVKLPTSSINVDEELSKVDNASLAKYMDNIEMPTEQATAHFNDVNSGDVDAALQDISDEAIQQHLDETGGLIDKNN